MQSRLKYFLLVPFIFLSATNHLPLREFKMSGYAQGTSYSISYFAIDSLVTQTQVDSILNVIDLSMSLYKPNSAINKFNKSETGIELDSHFAKVVQKSFEIFKDSKGIFDITVAPLVQYWGFGPKSLTEKPNTQTIENIMQCVGMDKLELTKDYLTKKKSCISIDLNGIAQGYSVDVVADFMLTKGIKIFVVEIGGELRVKGPKPDGKTMRIGIEGPSETPNAEPSIKHIMSFTEGAVTTSGNYRKYLTNGSKKISHLINAKTGYPLDNEMISATVFAPDAITADGYDNVLMGMTVKEALTFVEAHKNLEAYLIYKKPDGKIADTLSAGFRKMIIN
ncbi:FAD:protein FMN transferase [Pedobacter sp. LMG 31464]|uniref:FAD:protein FMN transferase n=1 Tax=Pedobacter planticolens TaxID=2679964 RepID=A0A923E129_9SPHI|nr:FAD:protein FMN transferase [Pedobacter planticolens]MBB2146740.1 FAD:protein FMN transferase [Pedobacter planticolens]